MGIQTYKIEMKLRVEDDQHEAFTALTMQFARNLMAAAALLAPGQVPVVICQTQDAFYDTTEIDLLEPTPELEAGE